MAKEFHPLPLVATAAVAVVGGFLGAAWYLSERINPTRKETIFDQYTFTPWELGVPFEKVTLTASDGVQIRGWWLPNPNPKGVIIACHGHTGRKDDTLGISTRAWRAGYSALLFDFRGRGESDPWPNSLISSEMEDLLAAVKYAQQREPHLKIGVVGFSMGGAVSILAAAREPAIAALVADCAFKSVVDVVDSGVRRKVGFSIGPLVDLTHALIERRHGYAFKAARPIDEVGKIAPRPILIIQSTDDTIVPLQHGHELFAAANEPKQLWISEGTEHCGAYFLDREDYVKRVMAFFDQYLSSVEVESGR